MKRYLLILLLVVSPLIGAQPLEGDAVMDNIRAAAEATEDVNFILTGEIAEADGSTVTLEVDIQAIPELSLARAEFFQPDAVADNFLILDGDSVYNYLFLTNQVTIFRADDPNAFGNLFPDLNAQELDLSLNLETLFAGYAATIESYATGSYTLRLIPETEDGYILAHIDEATWLPRGLEFFNQAGSRAAFVQFENLQVNSGLNPADVRFIPSDAERIDER
jgi:outer membrane lipoprotein-sorting protein